MNGLACLACERQLGAASTELLCPHCGGNLSVSYDLPALAARARSAGLWDSSRRDLFRYAALLPTRRAPAVGLGVGWTPLLEAPRLAREMELGGLWLKDDGRNPSASFKDRASAVALALARERGAERICAATTGNAGSSLACLCAAEGFPCTIFVPESAPAAKLAQLQVFGAQVLAVRGNYDQAFDLCADVCRRHGWFNRGTGLNPFTREGKKTVSFELAEQLDEPPDWVAVSAGDGNILSGVWKGWRELLALGLVKRTPRLLCVQAAGSDAICRTLENLPRQGRLPWSEVKLARVSAHTLADSIRVNLPRDGLAAVRAVVESGGAAVRVADEAILGAVRQLGRCAGVFAEPAAAASWAGVRAAREAGLLAPGQRVVCLITGSGLKDVDGARQGLPALCPVEATAEAVEQALRRRG